MQEEIKGGRNGGEGWFRGHYTGRDRDAVETARLGRHIHIRRERDVEIGPWV